MDSFTHSGTEGLTHRAKSLGSYKRPVELGASQSHQICYFLDPCTYPLFPILPHTQLPELGVTQRDLLQNRYA